MPAQLGPRHLAQGKEEFRAAVVIEGHQGPVKGGSAAVDGVEGERRDVHLMGDQDDGFRGRQAERVRIWIESGDYMITDRNRQKRDPMDLENYDAQVCRLRAGPVPVPEERVQRGQVLNRTEVVESGRVAAAAPSAGEDPVDRSRRRRGPPPRSFAPVPGLAHRDCAGWCNRRARTLRGLRSPTRRRGVGWRRCRARTGGQSARPRLSATGRERRPPPRRRREAGASSAAV